MLTGFAHSAICVPDVEAATRWYADVAGLRTTWFADPWATVCILLEKRHGGRPYWRQYQA